MSNVADLQVNEHEGSVLGVIARGQPLSRYQLLKALERSPANSYNTSKGSLYPLVGRMIERGFVALEGRTAARGTELLRLTRDGYAALTRWIIATRPEHSFAHDPLLLRILSLPHIAAAQRIRWIATAKAALLDKQQEIEEHCDEEVEPAYADIVRGASLAIVQAKLEWLDRLLIEVDSGKKTRGGSASAA